jgi:hypothetical protein
MAHQVCALTKFRVLEKFGLLKKDSELKKWQREDDLPSSPSRLVANQTRALVPSRLRSGWPTALVLCPVARSTEGRDHQPLTPADSPGFHQGVGTSETEARSALTNEDCWRWRRHRLL